MGNISQTTFSSVFYSMKMFEFRLTFHLSLFLRVQLTIFQHCFRKWLGAGQATRHYLRRWWLIYWHIYASLGPQWVEWFILCTRNECKLFQRLCWIAVVSALYVHWMLNMQAQLSMKIPFVGGNTWAPWWRLKSLATRLFIQQHFRASSTRNKTKAPYSWPLCGNPEMPGGSHPKKGAAMQKTFPCHDVIMKSQPKTPDIAVWNGLKHERHSTPKPITVHERHLI